MVPEKWYLINYAETFVKAKKETHITRLKILNRRFCETAHFGHFKECRGQTVASFCCLLLSMREADNGLKSSTMLIQPTVGTCFAIF